MPYNLVSNLSPHKCLLVTICTKPISLHDKVCIVESADIISVIKDSNKTIVDKYNFIIYIYLKLDAVIRFWCTKTNWVSNHPHIKFWPFSTRPIQKVSYFQCRNLCIFNPHKVRAVPVDIIFAFSLIIEISVIKSNQKVTLFGWMSFLHQQIEIVLSNAICHFESYKYM